jgi:asparagine synthase (glutamine-hydrolysing)
MCGIAGSVNLDFSYNKVARSMGHRGPDDQNDYRFDNVNFFHLRLSILDIHGGRQPMHLEDRYTIIFNGEIYNHLELRSRFGLKGRTSSDTETLLLLYEKLGKEFLQHLDGMFAFVIYDKSKKELFIARDRAGKKPLYYFFKNDVFAFCSELNCLKSMVPLTIQKDNFYLYFRLGAFYKNFTPYENVSELLAGTYLTVNCSSLKINETTWWDIGNYYKRKNSDSFSEAISQTDTYLRAAIKRRMESSDLEVGCFLSGGIDSGIVTAISSEFNRHLKTFTVSFEGKYDEAPLAELLAKKYGTHHSQINISFSHLKDDLEKILMNYGEPFFDSSVIPTYYVSKEAKKHVTVILNGDGADELFGGYRRYVPFARFNFFNKNPLLKGVSSIIRKLIRAPENKISFQNYLYRLTILASKTGVDSYLSAGVDIFEDYENNIKDPGFDYLQPLRNDFQKINDTELSGLKKIMTLDFNINLFCDLLVKMDIATMANSLEGRSPFLAKELLEYVPSLNDRFKIRGGETKVLLRKLAKKYLPDILINQPKRGFEIPLKSWVDNNLREIIFDYLSSADCLYKDFIKQNFVDDLMLKKINIPAEKRAKILWTLFSLEIWYKKIYK